MIVGRISKESSDVRRATVDLTDWLDSGEQLTGYTSPTILALGLVADTTPLAVLASMLPSNMAIQLFISAGTSGNNYRVQFTATGQSGRIQTVELLVKVQDVGAGDAQAGQGGAAAGVITLAADPTQPMQAATKQYVDAGDATKLPLVGGTMLGPITLAGAPTGGLNPATKTYTDLADAANAAAAANALSAAATAQAAANAAQTTANNALSKAGGTMTGPITLAADPASGFQPATKRYVDAAVGAALGVPSFNFRFNIAGAGNSQGTATALAGDVNEISSTSVGGGVILPASPPREVVVYSTAGADVLVYPPVGAAIFGFATNAPVTVSSGSRVTFAQKTSVLWLVG
jgi:hypothetical protein